MGSCCGLDTLPGRFPSVSPHKHQLPSNSWFARLAPVQAPLRVYPHTSYSTVPPCLQDEVRSTREQGNSDTRRPKNRSGVARRHFRRSVEQLAVAKGASMTPKVRSTREQGNSDTRRPKNRPGTARRHFRRSVEQLAVAKGASMTPKVRQCLHITSCRLCPL